MTLHLEDLAVPLAEIPPLDAAFGDGHVATEPHLREWMEKGVMHLDGILDHDVIDAYFDRYVEDAEKRAWTHPSGDLRAYDDEIAAGYGIGTPYLTNPLIRDLCLTEELTGVLHSIHNEPMGLHLNLAGWKSTTRAWHQDRYLNPPYVGNFYCAAWLALDDIHSGSGPFQYVPGSHRWPSIDRDKMLAAMGEDGSDPDWPWHSEAILGPLFDREIINRGAHVETFLGKKGDVLLWHPNLAHRGSVPTDPQIERRALIAHYSVISRRRDMPTIQHHVSETANGTFFVLGPVR